MAVEQRVRKLQYRKAIFLKSKSDLEKLLSAALRSFALVSDRQQRLSENDFRLINGHTRQMRMEFGDFINYELGTNKLLVKIDASVPELKIRQIAPPAGEAGHNEFLDSILYYGIHGNHVVLMQSQVWQSRNFENYLNWLLQTAGVLDSNDRVELSDTPPPDIRKKAEKADVKTITLRAPVMDLAERVPAQDAKGKVQERVFVPEEKIGSDVIRSILGDDEFKKLHLERAADGNLKIELKITFDRNTTRDGQTALNNLARVFRHADFAADDFYLDVPGIGKISGDKLKLAEPIRVETVNGQVNPSDVFPKMQAWLMSLVERGLVE